MNTEAEEKDSSSLQAGSSVPPQHCGVDPAEINALFVEYHSKLVKCLVARTGSWEEARDIASQAFAEVLAQRSGAVSFLGAYLYRTARNLALNWLTHRAMCKRKEPVLGYQPDSHPSPELLEVEEERLALLKRAIATLPPRLQRVLVLRLWDDLSCDEIASEFQTIGVRLTARTVQRYLADGLERCRQAIAAAETPPRGEAP
jgi:RNA polymerase sigma factor (sigma-70 family)